MRCKNVIYLMILLIAVISCESGIFASVGTSTTVSESSASSTTTTIADKDVILYTVTFNANGGSGAMSEMSMTCGISQNLPKCTFARDGYTFGGWNTKSNGSGTSYADKGSVTNLTSENGAKVTLYAKWTPIKYTLTFNANGGNGSMSNKSMTYGVSQNLPECTLTRIGYTFGGWNTKSNGNGTNYADKASVTNLTSEKGATVTLYAVWLEKDAYSIFYYYTQNESNPNVTTFKETQQIMLAGLSRVGYIFGGWFDNAECYGEEITGWNAGEHDDNVELYAKWTPIEYTVTFNANGGYASIIVTMGMTYDISENLPECTLTKTGYTFGGWNTEQDGSGTGYADKASVTNLTSEKGAMVTLYAVWIPITYTVTFNANGGSGSMSEMSMTYGVSQNLIECTLTKTGCTFGGWNTEQDGSGTSYADKASVTNLTADNGATVTLYAVWLEKGEHSIFYHNMQNASNPNVATFKESQHITLDEPSRVGYIFGGWFDNEECNGDKITGWNAGERDDNVELYAKWTPITYTVTFNANSGNGSMSEMSMTYDISQNLPVNQFTRIDYLFGGWNTEQDGSGTGYADKASVTNLANENGATVTLYAQWDKGQISQITVTAPIYNEIDGLLAYSNGTFTAKDGCASYSWYVDGRQQDETGRTFTPDKESLAAGVHNVTVEVYCDGRWYSTSCDITVTKAY